MKTVSFLRHAGWFSPEQADTMNIIGVGATGSYIGLLAAKMGFHKFNIWDADIVEDHNLPNQIYNLNHVGKLKVDAFEEVLKDFNPSVEINKNPYFFKSSEHKDDLDGVLVLTVDTMHARKDIFNAFKENWKVSNVYETRLGFDYGELNVIDNLNTNDLDEWYGSLKDDSEIPDGPCNLRICTTLVSMVAAHTVHTICSNLKKDFTKEGSSKKTIFNLTPRLSTYNIERN